jgi:hypothetical protein
MGGHVHQGRSPLAAIPRAGGNVSFTSPYLGDFPIEPVCAEKGCSRDATRVLVMVEASGDDKADVTVAFFCRGCADLRHVEWKEPDA